MESHGFSLSYQTFDLDYLLPYHRIFDYSNNIIPLWDNKNIQLRNEEQYLNFEIRDKNPDSDSDDDIKDDVSYPENDSSIVKSLCHLCNVEVPLGYMRMHQKSDKHKIFMKISEVALERVRKQMGECYPSDNAFPSMYFCQTCVILIPVKDKQIHLDSKHHKNSLLIDKLLKDFSNLYLDEEAEKDEKNVVSTSFFVPKRLVNINNKTVEVDKNDCVKDSNSDGVQEGIKTDPIIVIENKTKTNIDVKNQTVVTTKPVKKLISKKITVELDKNLKDFIKSLNTETSKYKLEYLDEYHMMIETEDGIKVKARHENFHSFFVLGKNHVQCKLCCRIARNINEHMFETEHLKKLALPVDKNCIRKMEDSKGHCIICNEVVENPEIHALCDRNHDKLLMQAMFLEKDENAAKVAQTGEIEQTKNDPIKTKVKKQERVLNEVEITEDNKVTNEEIVLKKGDTGATYYFCNVCYIRIYKNDVNIHCNNWKHQSNAKLDSHYLLVYSYALRKLKCIVCNIFFSVDAMREHLSSSNHESTYNALLAANYLKKSTRNVFCDICIVYMRIGNEIVHIESSGHARLLMSKNTPIAEPAKGQSSDNNSQKKISKTKHVKSTKKTKQDSSNGPLKNSKVQMKNDFCVIWKDEPIQNVPAIADSKSLDIKENESKNTTPKVGNDANTSSVIENKNAREKQVTCKVCDVTMLDNEEDIKNHLLYYHNIIYDAKQVIENSKMKLTGNVLICESCCEYVAIEEELKHLASPTHIVKSLIKTSTDSISHTENVLTNDDRNNNEIPSTSKNTQPISNEENLENKGQVYCLVCTTSLPNGPNSVKIHEDGKKHTANLKLLMSKNNITKRNDHLECEICAVPLEESDLFVHINSLTHLKSRVNTKLGVTTITYCEVCNKYITTKMETHILSITHKSKEIPKSIASYLCHVCDVLLTNSDMNITEHKKGGQHRNNLKILEANTIRINVDKCYCETCDMEFTFKLIRQHISTSQHLILMGNDVPQ